LGGELDPALLGVGYIIGPRIASIMVAGGILAYLVFVPAIAYFGEGLTQPLAPATAKPIKDMSVGELRGAYIIYIGAGGAGNGGRTPRTERDMPMWVVIVGSLALVAAIAAAPALGLGLSTFGLVAAVLIVLLGFLFVTVSSRLTGEIGSSSNPISGMTVATLLLTCLIFLVIGWTGPTYYVTALSIGGIVCIASSNGGTTSQDLKTGFLVGSTLR